MSEPRGGAARGWCSLLVVALWVACVGVQACIYDWPLSILPNDGGTEDGGGSCGNSILEPGEPCDGTDLGGETCGTQGFGGGPLACGPRCTLDTSLCQDELVCGDGWIGEGEGCDDGQSDDGDGCDANCDVEPGWICSGEPSLCLGGCGNGLCYTLDGESSGTCPEDCGWLHLATGRAHTCGVKGDGAVFCWGDNERGQLGDGSGVDQASPVLVEGLPAARLVTAGDAHSCALTLDDAIYCWGDNAEGQLGDGSIISSDQPVLVQLPEALVVSAGSSHTCAATKELEALCWGRNAEGQLGNGDLLGRQVPTVVVIGAGLSSARDVICGGFHSCAIREDGAALCWGQNTSGQLGTGTAENSLLPRAVVTGGGLGTAQSLSAGAAHTCAVDVLGALWCWGNGGQRRLGDGASQNRTSPVSVITVGDALDVGAGGTHSCALDAQGSFYCWGAGTDGQLGLVGTPPQSNPTLVSGLTGGLQVATGSLHTCALVEDRRAFCWGAGLEGQLGQGVPTGSATAVPVNDPY